MKKLLTLLAVSGMTLALAACGKDSENEPDGSKTETEGAEAETTPAGNDEPVKTDSLSIENVYWYTITDEYEVFSCFKDGIAYSRFYDISEDQIPEEGTVNLLSYATYQLKNTTASGGEMELNMSNYIETSSYTLSGDYCTANGMSAVNIATTKYKNLTFILMDGN